jgi:peptidoglycan/xylan/chitin deacetylase (PgdA/CDA1 family)
MTAGLVVVITLLGIALVVFWIEPLGVLGVFEKVTPNIIYRVRTERPLVALSFDDGPHPEFTPQVLEILMRSDARATFFLIGERALQYPDVVSRIRAGGHEVGNHYFSNGATLLDSDAEFAVNLEKTENALGMSTRRKLFRPPGGLAWSRQLRIARAKGYACVLGCAYPHDPMRPPVWYIEWLIAKNLRPGSIVILHDGISDPRRSIQALPHILCAGRERGLQFVSIGELLQAKREQTDKK